MSLNPGAHLGPYEILALLGVGGMGEVYRARDTRLGREVAIKVVRQEVAGDPEQLKRFEREARLLASLNHPNIATLYGFEESNGTRFLVMELVPGQTLAEQLDNGPLSVKDTLALACQLAEALQAAHQKDIIHRDLKPANVKITPEGNVKVLDFGLAKVTKAIIHRDLKPASVDLLGFGLAMVTAVESNPLQRTVSYDGTREGVILGTPAYMSPEQIRGWPLDERTDIWSFGCVLYEPLSGRRAFYGQAVADTFVAVLEREPDWTLLPQMTPSRVRVLLHRCLQKAPADRLREVRGIRAEVEEAARELAKPSPGT
jgi:eukaryotic-like serine/threonine-protein kinase